MVYSIYEEIISLSGGTKEDMKNKLAELNIAHIFHYPMTEHFEDDWFKPVVLYAAHAYSWESKMVSIGADWLKTKVSIAKRVALPEVAFEEVVHLKNAKFADCFMNFLHLYRDNMDYVHLTSLKEFYQQIMMNTTRLTAEGTEGKLANLDDKHADLRKGTKLFEEIEELEEKLKTKYKTLQLPMSDFKDLMRDKGNPLKIENSKYILG
jgi:hypothetical protein